MRELSCYSPLRKGAPNTKRIASSLLTAGKRAGGSLGVWHQCSQLGERLLLAEKKKSRRGLLGETPAVIEDASIPADHFLSLTIGEDVLVHELLDYNVADWDQWRLEEGRGDVSGVLCGAKRFKDGEGSQH